MRGDPFVLGAQPVDMSSLGLCQYNKHKMLLSVKLPQCPLSQLEILATRRNQKVMPGAVFRSQLCLYRAVESRNSLIKDTQGWDLRRNGIYSVGLAAVL
jgi:hypothetical protein